VGTQSCALFRALSGVPLFVLRDFEGWQANVSNWVM
jgi:hypothetical protein